MFFRIRRLLSRSASNPDKILKYPNGKRYYPDFHPVRKSYIDPDAIKVISRLSQFGYKSYLVGGGVRDLVLGRMPKDFDIVTSARPKEIKKLFGNSRLIGKRFRIVHIVFKGNKIIEVSTARAMPNSRDSAKEPDDLMVEKDNQYGTFKEDAARRDFTINSLFFDVRNETIIDYTGGYEDLMNKIIRVIGDENISLPEDPVRMLRAVKFASLLDFEIDPRLQKGISKYKKYIQKSSISRLHEEFNKIFRTGQTMKIMESMVHSGLFQALFPKISAIAEKNNRNFRDKFADSYLGKRLSIADRMISEHEDLNTTIYYTIMASECVSRIKFPHPVSKDIPHEMEEENVEVLRKELHEFDQETGLTKKEMDRLVNIYMSQPVFSEEVNEQKGWVREFRKKEYFQEAFIFYKIDSQANNDNEAIQKSLFWEIGLRKKLDDSIRKVNHRPVKNRDQFQKPKR